MVVEARRLEEGMKAAQGEEVVVLVEVVEEEVVKGMMEVGAEVVKVAKVVVVEENLGVMAGNPRVKEGIR